MIVETLSIYFSEAIKLMGKLPQEHNAQFGHTAL